MDRYCSRCNKEKAAGLFIGAEGKVFKTCAPCRASRNMQYKNRVRLPKPPRELDGFKVCTGCLKVFRMTEFAIHDRENRVYATCTACRARKFGKATATRKRKKVSPMPVEEMFGRSMKYMLMLRKPWREIAR